MKMRVGIRVTCATCGYVKLPIGRSAPLDYYGCNGHDCPGYFDEPHPGSLWPGETAADFGYPIGVHGTEEVEMVKECDQCGRKYPDSWAGGCFNPWTGDDDCDGTMRWVKLAILPGKEKP